MSKNIIDLSKNIENIVRKYDDLIGNEATNLKSNNSIDSSNELEEAISKIEIKDRVLNIGIVGRVKAGKSSLINALIFDGKSVLPKAATPMTASLVTINYGEKLLAEVEFFTKEDIANIKDNAKKYEDELNRKMENIFNELKEKQKLKDKLLSDDNKLKEKAQKRALREMKENAVLSSAYEQYEQIKKSGVSLDNLKNAIEANSVDELKEKLVDYVGANGRYMPFTKSVNLYLPYQQLKEVKIIDTPGVNDPVQSREERTRELLKYCDVIFIVSPSGQFMSNEDTELMDRITTKEGVRELFVIASQVDNQLFGSEKIEANGILPNVLKSITKRLGNHMAVTLKELKQNYPEIRDTFDSLIKEGENKVLYSSGICETLLKNFDNLDSLDDGAKKVWSNLSFNYPDYFSENSRELSIENLKLLSNKEAIENKIEGVKELKEQILSKRKEEFISSKLSSLNKYKEELIKYVNAQIENLENQDIDSLKKESNNLKNIKENKTLEINEAYYELIDELEDIFNSGIKYEFEKFFRKKLKAISDAEGEVTESYTVSTSKWYNPFSWGDEETEYETYTTAKAGAVRNAIEDIVFDAQSFVKNSIDKKVKNWRKNVYNDITDTLKKEIENEQVNINKLRRALRLIISKATNKFSIDFDSSLPTELKKSGTLEGGEAERFLREAEEYVRDIKTTTNRFLRDYSDGLMTVLKEFNLANELFDTFNQEIEKLEKELKDKELYIDKYTLLLNDLKGL